MSKQTFKGKILTLTKVTNNILRVYNQSSKSHRYNWYKEARDFALYLSAMYAVPLEVSAGIIAALSPIKRWEENMRLAEEFIRTGNCGHVGHLKSKAREILENPPKVEEILSGRKITAFYRNILGDKNVVTIDRHALSIALAHKVTEKEYQGMTLKQYNFFTDAYRLAAKKVGISPSRMQSSTWVYYRSQL